MAKISFTEAELTHIRRTMFFGRDPWSPSKVRESVRQKLSAHQMEVRTRTIIELTATREKDGAEEGGKSDSRVAEETV
jgi:hypothetical protein